MNEADSKDGIQAAKTTSKQLFFSLLLICILLITGFAFILSPAFSVGTISVRGNNYMTEAEVFAIAEIPEKVNIIRLNTGEIKARLSNDLRIEQVEITRNFPSTLILQITERRPIAYVACDYGFVEVDHNGMVMAVYRTIKQLRVPMITGIQLHNLYVGDMVTDEVLLGILAYLADLDETELNQMSEVNIANKDQLIAYTNNSVQIRIGKLERMPEKAKLTQEFLAELKIAKLPIEYVDFNFMSAFIKFKK